MASLGLQPGSTLGGYRILEVLGRGGMGVVYKAADPRQGDAVALKVISRSLAPDSDFAARFRREGRAQAVVSHANVVRLLGAGEEEGTLFLVLEHVPGGTLSGRLRERGRLAWREAAALGAGIARGLAAVHASGLVHRDLKPENVLLGSKGEPKLSDFGLVGAHTSSLALTQALTRTGEVVGTLAYVSPEQVGGQKIVGPRADLYSLGALLYTCLTGRPPFDGTGYALLKKHALEKPVPPREVARDIPAGLDALVLRLLEKKPDDRPGSADAVARALDALLREIAPRGAARPVLLAAGAVTLLLGLGAGAVLIAWPSEETRRPEEPRPAPTTVAPRPTTTAPRANADALRRLEEGRAQKKTGELDGALANFSRAIERDPRLVEAWLERAKVRRARKDLEGARGDADRAILLAPKNPAVWTERAWTLYLLNDMEAAIADASRAIELDPRDPIAWGTRGNARIRKGDLDGAIADTTRVIELSPATKNWSVRAAARLRKGDLTGAYSDLTRAVELFHEPRDLSLRGTVLLMQGDNDGAIADATAALEIDPAHGEALNVRSAARSGKGDLEGALADASRWVDLEPESPGAWLAKGSTLVQMHDRRALEVLDKATRLAPDSADAWAFLGTAKARLVSVEAALPDLDRAVKLGPKLAKAWAYRAHALQAHGETERAIADATQAISLDGNMSVAYEARGLAHRDIFLRDHDEESRRKAIADLESALALVPDSPNADKTRAYVEELRR